MWHNFIYMVEKMPRDSQPNDPSFPWARYLLANAAVDVPAAVVSLISHEAMVAEVSVVSMTLLSSVYVSRWNERK